jgi:hypothetical protein
VTFNYLVVNAGHATWEQVNDSLQNAGDNMARAVLGDAAADMGFAPVQPIVGSIVTPAAGLLIHGIEQLWIADCDGLVAAEVAVFNGSQLWGMAGQDPYTHSTFHPGLDSPTGCGSNSRYWASWKIERA